MTHPNAPLSAEGRRRLVERCQTRPIAHVAAEMGISRACASKWVHREYPVDHFDFYQEPWNQRVLADQLDSLKRVLHPARTMPPESPE